MYSHRSIRKQRSSSRKNTKGKKKKSLQHKDVETDEEEDEILDEEVTELTAEERNQIAKEICGVPDEKEETPEFVATCLDKLDDKLSELSYTKRKDWDRAVFLKPSLQDDKSFKLMFLRCENYNAENAAERMAKHFAFKRDLFGNHKLVKKITLDDLDENDLEFAKSGAVAQLLPHPDRSGRPVFFVDMTQSTLQNDTANKTKSVFHNTQSAHRYRFYEFMNTVEQNELAQTSGFVYIMYCPGGKVLVENLPKPPDMKQFFKADAVLNTALPCRLSSCHFCHDDTLTEFVIELFRKSMGRDIRLRLRTHFGSANEIRHSLNLCGIVTDSVIVSQGETAQIPTLVHQYLECRGTIEKRDQIELAETESKTGVVAYCQPNDVMLGGGRACENFPGNKMFRDLMDKELVRYKTREFLIGKAMVLNDIIQTIHDSGGRFLQRTELGWEIVNEAVTKQKMRKYYRSKPFSKKNEGGEGEVPTDTVNEEHDDPVGWNNQCTKRRKVVNGVVSEEEPTCGWHPDPLLETDALSATRG